jgi:hypothetical protein
MGIPGVFVLVQKHYCECVHSHLLSPSFGGGLMRRSKPCVISLPFILVLTIPLRASGQG